MAIEEVKRNAVVAMEELLLMKGVIQDTEI